MTDLNKDNAPEVDWQPGKDPVKIDVGYRGGAVLVRFPNGVIDGLALTPTDARKLAFHLKQRADMAARKAKRK